MRGGFFGGLSGGLTLFVFFPFLKLSSKNGVVYRNIVGGCSYRQIGTAHWMMGREIL